MKFLVDAHLPPSLCVLLHRGLTGFEQFEILYVEVVQPCAPGGKDDEAEVDTAIDSWE